MRAVPPTGNYVNGLRGANVHEDLLVLPWFILELIEGIPFTGGRADCAQEDRSSA